MKPILIHSLEDERIQPFRSLRKGGVEREETCVAEGVKGIIALLESDWEVLSFFAEEVYHEQFRSLLDKKGVSYDCRWVASAELMKGIVGYRMHQGVMALGKTPKNTPIEVTEGSVVALDSLANAENVGAVVRNAAAFGVKHLLVDHLCSSPFLRRSVKVSMGAIYSTQVCKVPDLPEALKELKKRGYEVVGAHAHSSAVSLNQFNWPKSVVLVMGSEGQGLRPEVEAVCDHLVYIPMEESVDSLNVAAASAVLFYSSS